MTAPLRIFVNGRFLTQPLSGMQRYAQELIGALDARIAEDPDLASGTELVVLTPRGELARRPAWRHASIRQVGRLRSHAWEQVELGWHARGGVLVSLVSAGPLTHSRQIVAMHDANVFANPGFFSRGYGLLHRTLRPLLARRAARLVTISKFSAGELSRYCRVPSEAFTLIHDSAEHILSVAPDPAALDRFGLEKQGYLLAVGNQSPNKNIALAIDAMAQTRATLPLAVAGGGVSILASAALTESDRVRVLGRVSDAELAALYSNAAAFVFPSRYEGFGVPPLEAMALGCPVLSSDTSAMPEILGDAPIYFPQDTTALASAIDGLVSDDEARSDHAARGLRQAACYSWKTGAETLLRLVRDLG